MTKACQLTTAAFDVAGAHVVEYQGPVGQVPPCQRTFNRRLGRPQPIKRRIDFLGADGTEAERHSERVDRRRLIQGTCCSQLRGRINHPSDNQRQRLAPLPLRPTWQQPIEADLPGHSKHRRHMPVR